MLDHRDFFSTSLALHANAVHFLHSFPSLSSMQNSQKDLYGTLHHGPAASYPSSSSSSFSSVFPSSNFSSSSDVFGVVRHEHSPPPAASGAARSRPDFFNVLTRIQVRGRAPFLLLLFFFYSIPVFVHSFMSFCLLHPRKKCRKNKLGEGSSIVHILRRRFG